MKRWNPVWGLASLVSSICPFSTLSTGSMIYCPTRAFIVQMMQHWYYATRQYQQECEHYSSNGGKFHKHNSPINKQPLPPVFCWSWCVLDLFISHFLHLLQYLGQISIWSHVHGKVGATLFPKQIPSFGALMVSKISLSCRTITEVACSCSVIMLCIISILFV